MRISGSNPEGMAVAPSPGGVGRRVRAHYHHDNARKQQARARPFPRPCPQCRVWRLRQGLLGQAGGLGQRTRHAGVGAANGKLGAP